MTVGPGLAALPTVSRGTDYEAVLEGIEKVMDREYGLHHICLDAIHSEASRFSIPMVISGSDSDGRPVRLFAKLMGDWDVLNEWVAQSAKNLYLKMSHREPLFGFARTPEEMARQTYEGSLAIHRAGIPTAEPLGYHPVADGIWMFVAEFLPARPIANAAELSPGQVEELFLELLRLHEHGTCHGDIKAENFLIGDRIYLVDAGVFREGASQSRKETYDVACLVCSLLGRQPISRILGAAMRCYPRERLLEAVEYVDLIQKRQDFLFDDRFKGELRRGLASLRPRAAAASRATGRARKPVPGNSRGGADGSAVDRTAARAVRRRRRVSASRA